jgi:ketosteroid isomerase-like protein
MSHSSNGAEVELQRLRERFLAADLAGNADAMIPLLADDVVILHPQCGVIQGKSAVAGFMRQVLSEVRQNS